MTATVILEIIEYLPLSFNFDGFTFLFKADDKSFEDTLNVIIIFLNLFNISTTQKTR
jgi:hypothetical protein